MNSYYTMEGAARYKGVSYHTVSRAVRNNRLPYTSIGRCRLIELDDLTAWKPQVSRRPGIYNQGGGKQPDPMASPLIVGTLLPQNDLIRCSICSAAVPPENIQNRWDGPDGAEVWVEACAACRGEVA